MKPYSLLGSICKYNVFSFYKRNCYYSLFLGGPDNWATYNIKYKTTSQPAIAHILSPVEVGTAY